MKNTLYALLALVLVAACAEKKEAAPEVQIMEEPGLEGAWELTHVMRKSPDTTTHWKPFKSIFIFTDKYYSVEIARMERPSWPDLEDGEERNPDHIINAFQGLISNSGSYEIVGDSVIHKVIVAKSPNLMNDYPRYARHLTMEKDSAYFTSTRGDDVETWVLKRLQ